MATKMTETKTTKKAEAKKVETKKAEPKKVEKKEVKKDTRVWHKGHPIVSGTYTVKLDGKEAKAVWVQGFRKGKWATVDGQLLTGKITEYTETK